MTRNNDSTDRRQFLKALTACVVIAGTRAASAAAVPPVDYSEIASLIEPGSIFDPILDDWGLDTSYDLNCDGLVDLGDLLLASNTGDGLLLLGVITHWGQDTSSDLNCDGTVDILDFLGAAGAFAAQETAAEPDSQAQVDKLLDDWGLDTSYDLNCDAIVDIGDLLLAFGSDDGLVVLGVVTHWGQDTSSDLDCDGTVGIMDFLMLLRVIGGATE